MSGRESLWTARFFADRDAEGPRLRLGILLGTDGFMIVIGQWFLGVRFT